jgi:hypothetical protein
LNIILQHLCLHMAPELVLIPCTSLRAHSLVPPSLLLLASSSAETQVLTHGNDTELSQNTNHYENQGKKHEKGE